MSVFRRVCSLKLGSWSHRVKPQKSLVEMGDWLPGDAVLTSFGVGVVVRCPNTLEDDETQTEVAEASQRTRHYHVRVWRTPGKSIGTTSTAYLQADAVSLKCKVSLCIYFDDHKLNSTPTCATETVSHNNPYFRC